MVGLVAGSGAPEVRVGIGGNPCRLGGLRRGGARRRRSPRLERARRQTMSVLFDELGALLPDLPPRVRSLVRPFPFLAIILFVSPAFVSADRGIELMPRGRPDP